MENYTDNLSFLFNGKQRKILSGFIVVLLGVLIDIPVSAEGEQKINLGNLDYRSLLRESSCDKAKARLSDASIERDAACRVLGDNTGCDLTNEDARFSRCVAVVRGPEDYSLTEQATQCPSLLHGRIAELKDDSKDLNSELRDLRDSINLHRKDSERTKERMEDQIQELEEKALEADAKANQAASRVTEEMEKAYGSRSQQMNKFTQQLREITAARDAAKAQLGLAADQEFLKADVTMKEYCYKRAFAYVEDRSKQMQRSQRRASDILSMSQGDYSTELARSANARYTRCMRSENSARARHLQRVRNANLRVQDIEISSAEQQILDMRRQISEYDLGYSQQLQGIEERSLSDSLAAYQEAETYRQEAARLKLTIQQAAGSGNQQDYYMDLQELDRKRRLKRERESELSRLEKAMPRVRVSSVRAFEEARRAVGAHHGAMKSYLRDCEVNKNNVTQEKYDEVQTLLNTERGALAD